MATCNRLTLSPSLRNSKGGKLMSKPMYIVLFFVVLWSVTSCSQPSRWTLYGDNKGSEMPERITFMTQDSNSNLWAADRNGKIYYYSIEQNEWSARLIPAEHGLTGNINTLAFAPNNVLWVGTAAGLGKYELDTNRWTIFGREDGLLNHDVRAILYDRQGNLWVGTGGGGIYLSPDRGASWEHVTIEEGFSYFTTHALFEDSREHIWVAGNALYRFEPEEDRWSTFTDGGTRYYSDTEPPRGIFIELVGDEDVRERSVEFLRRLDPSLTREELEVESDPARWMKPPIETIVMADDFVTSIAEDKKGALWFGTMTAGVIRYDPSLAKWVNFTTANGLIADWITAVAEDTQSRLWFGTSQGVSRFDPGNGEWTSFTKENGFTDRAVTSIVVGEDGALWFAVSGDKLYRFNPSE
jgi:ligand-binding sensor domain-containing protein